MNIKLFLVVTALTSLLCSVAAKKRLLSDHGQKEKSDLKREGNFRDPLSKRDPARPAFIVLCMCTSTRRFIGSFGGKYPDGCPERLEYCGQAWPIGDCCYPPE
ncbi:uncharacterized protein LOC114969516 [Acropora millepora]|uniref:uncharacterized protein LOC114969516 n=1 Tax=Acropora millepora TaxID=45264 RepID=UPI001CF21039|nr:uncharacterized protein LOC114969516 [Acropora millepora]XP_044171745.1 uncharacterized protein LOC114969516 [Acropora millepora]XP_044171746.1 uncharacterized protein LOC114969516 [Acropora millepora]